MASNSSLPLGLPSKSASSPEVSGDQAIVLFLLLVPVTSRYCDECVTQVGSVTGRDLQVP